MSHMTEGFVAEVLRKKYIGNEWAFMCQVRNETGFPRVARTADAMAFGLWPTRGLEILGFEIKVSRADWQREREQPEKAEAIAQYCHRWWIIAPYGIVKREELPAGWGLQEVEGTTLKLTVPAPKLKPKEGKRAFWMSVMKSFSEQALPESVIVKRVEAASVAAHKEGFEAGRKLEESSVKQAEAIAEQARKEASELRDEMSELLRDLGCSRYEVKKLPLRELLYMIRERKTWSVSLEQIQYAAGALDRLLNQLGTIPAEQKANGE